MTFERAESTIPVAFDFSFIKTSGIVPGVTADEGATCLVLLVVDTGYMKAVQAAGKSVTENLVEGGKRFVEQFFRRRVRLRCDGEPTTLAYGARLKELFPESVMLERTPRHDSQGNPAERAVRTLEEQARLKELFPESVMLERTPRHDSQGNPAERAVRTLEEQVKWILRSEPELSFWQTRACAVSRRT